MGCGRECVHCVQCVFVTVALGVRSKTDIKPMKRMSNRLLYYNHHYYCYYSKQFNLNDHLSVVRPAISTVVNSTIVDAVNRMSWQNAAKLNVQ